MGQDGGLQTREREVVPLVAHGPREGDGRRVAGGGELVDDGASRVAQAEVASHLVEGFSGGVVQRLAEDLVQAVVEHVDEHGVAAGDDKRDRRRCGLGVLQEVGVDVGLQVVHADQGYFQEGRQRLGRGDADDQRPHQPGADRDRDGVQVPEGHVRLPEHLCEGRVDRLDVGP